MEQLQAYYDEHAQQARQHENQRERVTNIILTIAGFLIGLITFAKLSLVALAASLPLTAIGVFGFLFAGKHYERFKFHTKIMKGVRGEIDSLRKNPNRVPKSLSELRREAGSEHYKKFVWPRFKSGDSDVQKDEEVKIEISTIVEQKNAKSWIARQRLHVFWEAIPLLVAVLGMALSIAIFAKSLNDREPEPLEVKIVSTLSSKWMVIP